MQSINTEDFLSGPSSLDVEELKELNEVGFLSRRAPVLLASVVDERE